MTAWEGLARWWWVVVTAPWMQCVCVNVGELSLAGLLDGLHPAIFIAVAANHLGTNGGQDCVDLLQGLGAQKCHLLLKEQCHRGTDENRVPFKDVHIPEAGRLVEGKMAGEEAVEHVAKIRVGVVVFHVGQVVVKGGRLSGQRLEDQVVGRGLGASIGDVEAQRQGAVEDVGERDERIDCVGKVEQKKSCNGLVRGQCRLIARELGYKLTLEPGM